MPPPNQSVVLLVGNDPSLAASLERILAREGHRVMWFDDPDQALEHAGAGAGDLALILHDADHFDATDFIETLRSMRAKLPTILLNISARHDATPLNAERRASLSLSLPLTHDELVDGVVNLLDPRRSREMRGVRRLDLEGALSQIPFEVVLFQAFSHRFTGQIVVEQGHMRKVIFLLRGFPVGATSNIPTEAIGNMLLQRGLIDRAALHRALARLKQTQSSIGQLLIAQGSINEHNLQQVLNDQVRERVLACFELIEGRFELFSNTPSMPPHRSLFTQNPISLIQVGISRFRDTSAIESFVDEHAESFVIPTHHFVRLVPYLQLGESRRDMIAGINGRNALSKLRESWGGNEPAFMHFFWTLHTTRLLFLSPTPIPSRAVEVDEIVLPPNTLEPLMKPRAQRARQYRRPELRSGTFQGLLGVPSLNLLLALSNEQLEALNYFELFGLHPDATAFHIHTQVRNLVLYLRTLQPTMVQESRRNQVEPLRKHLEAAARILLDADARERYRSSLTRHSGEELAMARKLLEDGRFDEATAALEQMEAVDPTNPVVVTLLALAIFRHNGVEDRLRLARAQALLARAIALDEQNADAYHVLGCIERDLSNPDQARFAWERALSIDPGHPGARAALAGTAS